MKRKQLFGKRGAAGRILNTCLALLLLFSLVIPASAAELGDGEATPQEPEATVTYEFYNGEDLYDSQTLKNGETLAKPADPVSEGRVFDGWYTARTDGEEFTAFGEVAVTETGTVKLYAVWTETAGETSTENDVAAGGTEDVQTTDVSTYDRRPGGGGTNTGTYKLYIYTLIPGVDEDSSDDADEVWNGMGIGEIKSERAPSSWGVGTIRYNGDAAVDEAIKKGDITYSVDSFPETIKIKDPITTEEYKYAEPGSGNEDKKGYYTIKWIRVRVADGANAGNNDHINPGVDSGTNTFHLDGVLILNEKDRVTVNFAVKDPGNDAFVIQDKYSTRVDIETEAGKLTWPDKDKYPDKEVGGITYTFDGWYTDETCTQKVNLTDKITKNTTYYAHYIPATVDLTVTKLVSGELGDRAKEFNFTYTYTDENRETKTDNFTLTHSGTQTIKGIPSGTELTLKETNAEGYKVSVVYDGDKSPTVSGEENAPIKTITITVDKENATIIVTNDKGYIPDTGVLLDSLPYILILIIVAAGTIAYFFYRRRRYED